MSTYHGMTFIFDGISSETYGLYLMTIGSGSDSSDGISSMDIMTDSVYRNPKQRLYGTSFNNPLKGKLTIASFEPIDSYKRSVIQRWLLGHNTYKKLQIIQDDIVNVYFNCILDNSKITSIGNMPYAFEIDVICDAPWAWEFPKTNKYLFASGSGIVNFINTSDHNDYLNPIVKFTVRNAGSVRITNSSNSNAVTQFDNLQMGEIITMDSELDDITSSTGLNRVTNFVMGGNADFVRLIPNRNTLNVENISSLEITYQNARKVGAM